MTDRGVLESTVRESYRLIDAREFDEMAALYSEDCVYERPGASNLRGRAALKNFYSDERPIASSEHRLDSVVCQGDRVAVEGEFEGTIVGGEQLRMRFADMFTMKGPAIHRRTTYFFAAP